MSAEGLKVTELGKGQYTMPEMQGWVVVREAAMFKRIWRTAHSSLNEAPPVPEVDFAEDAVIALFMGPCESAGYEIAIKSAWKSRYRVILNIKEHFPANNQNITQSTSHPWALYLISGVGNYRVSFDQVKKSESRGRQRGNTLKNYVGDCPLCGKRVFDGKVGGSYPGWYCEDRKNCGFHSYKTILGKKIRKSSFQVLLREGLAGPLKGFVKGFKPKEDNSGKPTFDAMLVIDKQKKRPVVRN